MTACPQATWAQESNYVITIEAISSIRVKTSEEALSERVTLEWTHASTDKRHSHVPWMYEIQLSIDWFDWFDRDPSILDLRLEIIYLKEMIYLSMSLNTWVWFLMSRAGNAHVTSFHKENVFKDLTKVRINKGPENVDVCSRK